MNVWQDDMGLGTTNGQPNVQYDARLGSNAAEWRVYNPFTQTAIQDLLDESETEELDFSILIKKFPPNATSTWNGIMVLGAAWAEPRHCEAH